MKILILGLSFTSSWGNGHATTYRSLIKGLYRRGHQVLFLERDVPRYRENRDMPVSRYCNIGLYSSLDNLKEKFSRELINADMVIIGSYVREGVQVSNWIFENSLGVKVFYDLDTPVTMTALEAGTCKYLHPDQVARFDIYLSSTAGKSLAFLQEVYEAKNAAPLYCSVDPELYFPEKCEKIWDLGCLGTYSPDRQPFLERLMLDTAIRFPDGKFVVAGPQYPDDIKWPSNVERIGHLPPADHNRFYNSQKFTLNITRRDMIFAGYSPSVRLFEAAACGVPVISDMWEGLSTIFEPGKEIFISCSAQETLSILKNTPEEQRKAVGENARRKVLRAYTGDQRALELEQYFFRLKNKNKISLHV